MTKTNKGFTLVELIVVITILAILGTIAFLSLQGYSKSARDSVRISDISNIKSSLDLFELKTGHYPEPDNPENVTYSGGTVWTQGTVGDNMVINLSKLNKKPLDPLTGTEYTYSVLNTKNEYEIGSIMEGGEVSVYNINKSYALSKQILKAYVTGNYNGMVAKVSTGSLTYVLATPSIIGTEVGDLQDIVNNKKLIYNGYSNLPKSYSGTIFDTNGETNLILTNQLLIYSGLINDLNDSDKLIQFTRSLQNAYSGTQISSQGEINNILKTESEGLSNLASLIINHYLGGNIKVEESNGKVIISNSRSLPVGSIIQFDGISAPDGWFIADGSLINRTTYSSLFTSIGTTFGVGDGSTTFALPDLRGRTIIGDGQGSLLTNRILGQSGGEENHTLLESEMPSHNHDIIASNTSANLPNPDGKFLSMGSMQIYSSISSPNSFLNIQSISNAGNSQYHNNMMPYVIKNYIIKYLDDTVSTDTYNILTVDGWNKIVDSQILNNGLAWFMGNAKPISSIYGWGECSNVSGRTVIGNGEGAGLTNRTLGQVGGEENHTLLESEMPNHSHSLNAYSDVANNLVPVGNILANTGRNNIYTNIVTNLQSLSDGSISSKGDGIGHNNMLPYLVLNCIKRNIDITSLKKTAGNNISSTDWLNLSNKFIPIGTVLGYGGTSIPTGYFEANGQILNISSYPDLYSILGTTYGGDGIYNFALPDLRGRTVIGKGQGSGLTNRILGQVGGEENHTLLESEMPNHNHSLKASTGPADSKVSNNNVLANTQTNNIYKSTLDTPVNLLSTSLENVGGGQYHNNMQPYVVVKFLIKY